MGFIKIDFNKFKDQLIGMAVTQAIVENDKLTKEEKDYIFKLIKVFVKHGVDFNTALNILNDISDLDRN